MAVPVRRVVLDTVDLTVGTAAGLWRLAGRAAGVTAVLAAPALVALRLGQDAARRLPVPYDELRDTGGALRERAVETGRGWLDVVVPAVADALLDRIDLTDVVTYRVDLDRVVREVDIEAVLKRVDIDAVAARLDVDAVVARADLEAAIARLDLIGLAEYVVDGIDLPKIIRESSGSVASEGLRQVRLTSFEADRALSQFVDRVMLRRSARRDGHVPLGGADGDDSGT